MRFEHFEWSISQSDDSTANRHNEIPIAQYESRPYTANSNLPATEGSVSTEKPRPKLGVGGTISDSDVAPDRQRQTDVLLRYT